MINKENKSKIKKANKAKLIVDFFELNADVITCYCYNPDNDIEENYTPIAVKLEDFETWLNSKGYLSGSFDEIKHPDDPCQTTVSWNYSIDEFMDVKNHNWNISDLLTNFLNKK